MQSIQPILLALGLLFGSEETTPDTGPDLALLREMLHDRQNVRGQSQAALLLLESKGPEAETIIRQGLQQTEDVEAFQALALSIRLCQDTRFADELLRGLSCNRPGVRQVAAETLALLPDPRLVTRLGAVVEDPQLELAARLAAVWALGHSGRKKAVGVLLEHLEDETEVLRRASAEALAELSGQNYGLDVARWQKWWARQKEMTNERWLEQRLAFQLCRSRRLESELDRNRTQVLRLHQQLYVRLPAADRLNYIQSVVDQEDAAVRALAVNWLLEQLATTEGARQPQVGQMLLRLSQDCVLEVQRAAVLGLGRINDPTAFERLQALLSAGRPAVRAAAARSLAWQARGTSPEATERQKMVLPALQKALADPALEVVVEAAEDLGTLGALEAGPVLTGLLHHPSSHVRQTAAQALERVADASLVDALLKGLNDSSVAVRFSLLGALGRAVSRGTPLGEPQQKKLLARLELLLLKDSDPGVRSRAATVLGECGPPTMLPVLWKCVLAGDDARVQEKAWAAFLDVIARAGNLPLLQEWDHTLAAAHQGPRRLQLLTEIAARWQKREETRPIAAAAQEELVQAELELGKWPVALPQVRELLSKPGTTAEVNQRLRWLLTAGEQALQDGSRSEAIKAVQDAQPYLPRAGDLADGFQKLGARAGGKE
jgi:HEAT repeat protein